MPSLFRQLSNQIHRLDPRLLLILFIFAALLISGFTSTAFIHPGETAPTPTPSRAAPLLNPGPATPTPFPPEYENNQEQTVAPTLAAGMLVLVVLGGVLPRVLRRGED